MGAPRRELLGSVRLLYARGLPIARIAEQTGLASATVYRWKARDAQNGISWEVLRGKAPFLGLSLVSGLESLLTDLVEDAGASPVERARALADLHRILEREREYEGELIGLGRFLAWAASSLPPAEQESVSNAAAHYMQQVRGLLASAGV